MITNKLIFAHVLNEMNKLEEVRLDYKKNKFIFIKGSTYNLDNVESIDLIGLFVKDNSKFVFFTSTFISIFITVFFTVDVLSLFSAIISSIIIGTLFAYTAKLFKIESKLYRILLNQIPYNLLISDLDVYDLQNYINLRKAIQTNE